MCGISGIHFFNSKKTSMKTWERESLVNELLLGIEHRGRDATGIATIRGNGDIWVEKAELEAREFVKHRTGLDKKVKTILLHTRAATKGDESNNLNNHPVINDNAVIIHNGHISNDDELFAADKELNRTAEVDSEVIAALVNKYGLQKAHLALQKLEGGFAVAAIDQRIPTALFLAKGRSSPLAYFMNNNFIIWASESRTIIDAFDKVMPSFDLKVMDIDYLFDGDILYMDHGRIEKLHFEVKERLFVPKKPAFKYTPTQNLNSWGYKKESGEDIPVPKEIVPKNGKFEIIVDGKTVDYRCCFKCGTASNEDFLNRYDGGFWCDICLEDEVEWVTALDTTISEEMEEEDKILAEFYDNSKKNLVDEAIICEKIAKTLGLSRDMVEYFLFDCEELMDGEIENSYIVDLYSTICDLYEMEVGVIAGDDVEKEEAEKKKMEIVKKSDQFIGL